jgi:hypothetical protein
MRCTMEYDDKMYKVNVNGASETVATKVNAISLWLLS